MSRTRWTMNHAVRAAVAATIAVLAGVPFACAGNQFAHPDRAVPEGAGTVGASEGLGGDTDVAVRIAQMSLPSKLALDATTFVVWIQPPNAAWRSLGTLTVDGEGEGTLETTTPYRQFLVMVTPESSGEVAAPSNAAVVTADVDVE